MSKGKRKPVVAPTQEDMLAYIPVGMRVKSSNGNVIRQRHAYGVVLVDNDGESHTLATGLNKSAAQACCHCISVMQQHGSLFTRPPTTVDEGTVSDYKESRGLTTREGD